METISENASFGGTQGVYSHASAATGTDMTFAVYLPPAARAGKVPVLWFLSGLTCTHENAMTKAGAQGHAAKHGVAMIFPDTSPRGDGVADDEAVDMGQGAGFYLDATEAPWGDHFKMETYITRDLPETVFANLPLDLDAQAITGHSMGGHGALTLAARHPGRFRSVSAFSAIGNPSASEWGKKQFEGYLGSVEAGADHDAARLITDRGLDAPILLDTGTDDQFGDKLGTEALHAAITKARLPASMNMRPGYDHSYFFVSTFMESHIAFHAEHLR